MEICPTGEETDCYWEEQTTVVSNVPYTYDAVWNRTGSGITLQPTSNRYQTFGGYTFEYDPDGNTTRKYKSGFNQVFSWNSLGQLTGVTTNGVAVTYRYNGFGERVYRAAGSDVRQFVYDGPDLVLEVSTAGTKLREYTHFPGVDQPHSMFDGNGTAYYYAMDYPGHVAGLFNTSGSVVNRYRYSAWGAPETTSEGVTNSLRFMSRELDAQTGVYYVRNRWYDAAVARFLSEDPIGLEGGINLYAYVGNSPTNGRDPFGLWPWVTPRDRFSTPRDEGYNGAASSRGGGSMVGSISRAAEDGAGGGGGLGQAVKEAWTDQACRAAFLSLAANAGLDVAFVASGGLTVGVQALASVGRGMLGLGKAAARNTSAIPAVFRAGGGGPTAPSRWVNFAGLDVGVNTSALGASIVGGPAAEVTIAAGVGTGLDPLSFFSSFIPFVRTGFAARDFRQACAP